jgi:hypothetical protein
MAIKVNNTTVIDNSQNWTGNTIPVSKGGSGGTTFTVNGVLLGNGTSAFQVVSPGASGNVLISNGTTWESGTAPAGGDSIPYYAY